MKIHISNGDWSFVAELDMGEEPDAEEALKDLLQEFKEALEGTTLTIELN